MVLPSLITIDMLTDAHNLLLVLSYESKIDRYHYFDDD